MITQKELKELLHYDPDTGVFTWKVQRGKVKRGDIAGCKDKEGYPMVTISRRMYFAHRLAWLYVYGEWPSLVDHINRDKSDNRIKNLRIATNQENCRNRESSGKSNHKGVYWQKSHKRWVARISINGERIYLG